MITSKMILINKNNGYNWILYFNLLTSFNLFLIFVIFFIVVIFFYGSNFFYRIVLARTRQMNFFLYLQETFF